ncbi:MAG: 6,7-dimethyl-8-ribityllumazine synthase [Gemmatimonadaceae bacterium]
MAEFAGSASGRHRRIAVVVSRFNESITQRLVDGATDALTRHGTASGDIDVVWVPGAWELPLAVRRLLGSERYDAIVALGAVIRGETPHFDYVAGEAARGLAAAAAEHDVPIAFGLLTCDDLAQADARAGGPHGNKGWDAAMAALEMADLFDRLDAGADIVEPTDHPAIERPAIEHAAIKPPVIKPPVIGTASRERGGTDAT